MSHFITTRTRIRERERLIEALEELGVEFRTGDDLWVRGDTGRDQRVEAVISTGSEFNIGLREENGAWVIVADWYNVELSSSFRRERFVSDLTQRYSYCVVREQAREQDLVIEEETAENGEIILLLSERG